MKLSTSLQTNIKQLEIIFPIKESFDLITRDLHLGETKAYWLGINGLCKNELLLKIFSDMQNLQFSRDETIDDLQLYMSSKIGYIQAEKADDFNKIIKQVLSGASVLFIDTFDTAIILDTRSYPARSIEEPDSEKVTRGAKDGFVETVVFNTALIRRRIRNPKLTFEVTEIGRDSKTDVVIGYVAGMEDPSLLSQIKKKLKSLDVSALTMGSKSLEELLIDKKWYHPLPQIRYTERPDVACSFLLEGYICILVDNCPTSLILPCTIFQFTQNPDDYYVNPSIGNYFRFIRFFCIILSLFLMPCFYLLAYYHEYLPSWLQVVSSGVVEPVTLFLYILVIEFGLDLFKYSSSLAPNGYSHSLGLIGGLLIGQMAVDMKLISIEALFYGAATLLATISITSKELSDALRLFRLFLVFISGFFHLTGFIIGTLLVILSIATTKSFGNKSYLWPLVPFNGKALMTLIFRYPTPKAQKSP